MKKLLLLLVASLTMLFVGCSQFDDSRIWDAIDELEEEQEKMQEQIDAQQTLLNALANNLSIISITPTAEGFLLTFSDGSTITVKHGEKGDKGDTGEKGEQGEKGDKGDTGEKGEDGADGKDGQDGKDGADGKDGQDGKDGADGDSLFQSVTWDEEYAYFTLADGTVIKIPLASDSEAEEGDLPPANEIWYTSTDGEVVTPYNADAFGVYIISNTYENGVGIITFDGDVTSIGDYAFVVCESLASVTTPDSVTSIGYCAFYNCSSLAEFRGKFASSDGRCLIIDGVLNFFAPAGLTEYTIPDSVTSIGDGAFDGCSSLASVTIPDSVTSIGNYAFYECYSLTSVYCKATTPPTGGDNMFYHNASGRKIYVPTESVEAYKAAEYWSVYADDIVGYDFENGGSGEDTPTPPANEIWYTSTDGNIVEPRVGDDGNGEDIFGANIISNIYQDDRGIIIFDTDLEVIRMGAFMLAENLQSLTIPNNVSIEGNPAIACYNLVEFCGVYASKDGRGLVVDGEMKSFAPSGLTEYTIPEEVTTIGFYSFGYCESLEKVIIPETVSAISNLAFPDSPNIKAVYCKSTTPPTGGGDMFYNHASDRKIYVPTESVDAYKTAEWWSDYADAIEPYVFE